MRKITLLLMSFILCVGYMNAQIPEGYLSSDDGGPWYIVKVRGETTRVGRVFTATYVEAIDGTPVLGKNLQQDPDNNDEEGNPLSIDINTQLWRIESIPETSNYSLINKANNEKLVSWSWPRSQYIEGKTDEPALGTKAEGGENAAWKIYVNSDTTNHFTFEAATPIEGSTTKLYAHQGNAGFNWGVVLEVSTWGFGVNSQFCFVRYQDGITVEPGLMDYGPVALGKASGNVSFTVAKIAESDDEFLYEITGDDADYFAVEPDKDWSDQSGGALISFFEPDESEGERNYSAELKITCGDSEILIPLVASSISGIPGTLSTDGDEHWYRIQFDKRYAYYIQDQGTDQELDAYPGFNEGEYVDGQLWKIVATETRERYKLVSKLGNEIKFNEETGLFESAKSSGLELGFAIRTDGAWLLSWPEFANVDDDGNITYGTYFNKTKSPGIGVYNSTGDEGNSIIFIPAEEAVETADFPSMNTEYFIQFVRPAASEIASTITNQGIGNNLKLELPIADNEAQIWTFVGTWNDFKIVSKLDNSEFKDARVGDDDMTQLAASGEGHSYRFLPPLDGSDTWAIYDNDFSDPKNGVSHKFLNQHGGGASVNVGLWTIPDAGSNLQFIPADELSIDNIYTDVNDPVVSTTYYTVQGVQVTKPTAEGVYIVRMRHESQKVTAKKIIYRKGY